MKVLTIKNITERYGIGRQSFWRWRKHNNFPNPISPPLARPFWRIQDIEAWEAENSGSEAA